MTKIPSSYLAKSTGKASLIPAEKISAPSCHYALKSRNAIALRLEKWVKNRTHCFRSTRPLFSGKAHVRNEIGSNQGCQICIDTMYVPKRGKNISYGHKVTKWPQNYQMTIKYTVHKVTMYSRWPENIPTFVLPRPSKIYPNWGFWWELYTIWQPWFRSERDGESSLWLNEAKLSNKKLNANKKSSDAAPFFLLRRQSIRHLCGICMKHTKICMYVFCKLVSQLPIMLADIVRYDRYQKQKHKRCILHLCIICMKHTKICIYVFCNLVSKLHHHIMLAYRYRSVRKVSINMNKKDVLYISAEYIHVWSIQIFVCIPQICIALSSSHYVRRHCSIR
jgi:hypothetical protein